MQDKVKKQIIILSLYVITAFVLIYTALTVENTTRYFESIHTTILIVVIVILTKNAIFLFLNPWHDVRNTLRAKRNQNITKQPHVSIIIPAWNEEVGIIRTIKSVLNNTYTNTEIVVVNDGSTDSTHNIISSFVNTYTDIHHRTITYLRQTNKGKAAALNYGIANSTGEIVISLDADSVLEKNAIRNFVRHFDNPTVMAAMGKITIGNTDSLLGLVQYFEYALTFAMKKTESLLNIMYIIGGAAGAYRRETLDIIGLYDTKSITEDVDLSIRIQSAGMQIAYAHDAIVTTEGAGTIAGLVKQRLRWRRGRLDTLRKHKNLFFSTDKKHNKILSWFALPYSLLSEVQLFFEPLFVGFVLTHSLVTMNLSSFATLVLVISYMVLLTAIFHEKNHDLFKHLYYIPTTWILFYITVYVEYIALIKTFVSLIKKQEVKWQNWSRTGVYNQQESIQTYTIDLLQKHKQNTRRHTITAPAKAIAAMLGLNIASALYLYYSLPTYEAVSLTIITLNK